MTPVRIDQKVAPAPTGEVRHGTRGGPPDVRLLGGYFVFDSPDAALLVSLLPELMHVRGAERLSVLVRLVGEESRVRRSGRDLVLTRLVEVLLIEALRSIGNAKADAIGHEGRAVRVECDRGINRTVRFPGGALVALPRSAPESSYRPDHRTVRGEN